MAAPPPAAGAGAADAAAALRERVYRRVLSSDVLNSTKAHLRARLYAELKGSSDGGDPLAALPPGRGPPSLHNHVLNCLVAEHLLVRRLKYSLSVFLVESGSGALPQLPCADVLRLVGVLPESSVHTLLMAAPGHKGGSDESDASSSSGSPPALSLAERMVAALGALGGRVTTAAAACQTGEDSGAPSPLQLGQRLAAIEDEYRRKSTQLEAAAAERLEQRMAAYQAECDTRCAAQLQDRLAALREGELAAVRGHEAEAHARALEAERGALQAAHLQRLAALRAAEDELAERGRRAQREQDALREQHLRRLRAEEERLAAWKADSEAKAAAQDAAARQRLQAAKAAAQQAETQHAAAERRLSTLLAEVQAREESAVRAQAAAQAELGRIGQVQAQLTAALQEQGALRQQLAADRAGHQVQVAQLRAEVEALQQCTARSSAAATGPALSPAEAARLQAAVRRLVQRADELQAEVEACRGRERVWKGSAAEAERLLDKAAKAHDGALRHSEELRLALAAAIREVADLQQQAAMAAAAGEPLAASLQAVSRDAQRWCEDAEARVAAAKLREDELQREAVQLGQRVLTNRTGTAHSLQRVLAAHMQSRRQSEEGSGGSSPDEPLLHAVPPTAPRAAAHQLAAERSAHVKGTDAGLPPARSMPAPEKQHPPQPPAPQQVAQPPPQLPSRTASDILAAYRARQQQSSSRCGGGTDDARLRSTSQGQEAAGAASTEGGSEGVEGAAAELAQTGAVAVTEAAAAGGEPSCYTVDSDGFDGEDSGDRF